MSQVTRILERAHAGGSRAADQLLPLVYDELRKLAAHKLAQESPDHTLQPTALVHEAWLRLNRDPDSQRWDDQGHFFAAAAEAMRRILVENARRKARLKRGGSWDRVPLEQVRLAVDSDPAALLSIDQALEELAVEHPETAPLVPTPTQCKIVGKTSSGSLSKSPPSAASRSNPSL